MIVDSSATTARPALNAEATSGETVNADITTTLEPADGSSR
jgi:hypothetical protein